MRPLYLVLNFFLIAFSTSSQNTIKFVNAVPVLFVGNSLTYTNDLPGLVKGIAISNGDTIITHVMAYPDFSLEDHWNRGQLQKEISSGKYQFIIVQQGPSSLPESRKNLVDYVSRISDLCKENKARLIVFMVWPGKDRISFLPEVIMSYADAAHKTNSLLAPAGVAWKTNEVDNNALKLYGDDDLHPSLCGSMVAALCIYGSMKEIKKFDFLQPQYFFQVGLKKNELIKIVKIVESAFSSF
jgi:hypothetical protein